MACERRPIYGPVNQLKPDWTGGSRSIVSYANDCWFKFSVTTGSAGIICGLNDRDLGTEYTEIQHGFHVSHGRWKVIESGVAKTLPVLYTEGDEFYIIRFGSDVLYCVRPAGAATEDYTYDVAYPGIKLPGPVYYKSSVPSYYTVFLDASFYNIGDTIYNEGSGTRWDNVEEQATADLSGAEIEQRMNVFGLGRASTDPAFTSFATVPLPFGPDTANSEYLGTGTAGSGANIELGLYVLGSDDLTTGAATISLPITAFGDGAGGSLQPTLSGANISLIMEVVSSGAEAGEGAEIDLPISVFGTGTDNATDAASAIGDIELPLTVIGGGSAAVTDNGFFIPIQFGGPVLAAFDEEITEFIQTATSAGIAYSNNLADVITVGSLTANFSRRALEITETLFAGTSQLGDLSGNYESEINVSDALTFQLVAILVENILATSEYEISYHGVQEILNEITLSTTDYANRAVSLAETINLLGSTEVNRRLVSQLVSAMTAGDAIENTLTITVTETAEFTAADSIELDKHLLAEILEHMDVYSLFRVSGEVAQGWVMNTEGAQPISEYDNFNFNSMTFFNDTLYSAGDSGIYTHGANDDAGADITAELTSMLLDFGTSRMKRIRSAYMGYTSENELVLKVRSISQGEMTEDWFKATQTTTADSPDGSYMHVGQGLKSRYWQFELTNIDGGDFEVDMIELHPLMLNRRI